MNRKLHKILLLFAGLVIWAGCGKVSPDGLQGRWEPVYASGSFENAVYVYTFDGPVDEHGHVTMFSAGKNTPDVKREETMLITGYRFFRKNGEDVYITFYKDNPREEIGKPLLYKVENGKLYCELPRGALINSFPEELDEGSGQFGEGTPISFLNDGQLKIGNITYKRK